MKKFKFLFLLNFIFVMLVSCGTVKEGFSMQKKNNSDEFLVEKKSPLLMPPDFNELPIPNPENALINNENNKNNEIKKLITKSEDSSTSLNNSENTNGTVEEFILGKIKNN